MSAMTVAQPPLRSHRRENGTLSRAQGVFGLAGAGFCVIVTRYGA